MKKFLLGVFLSVLFVANSALAMTFSQPVKIGEIGYINLGGFLFKQVSHNEGVLSERRPNKNTKIYDHGIARFGDGFDALYLHYDSYKANVQGKTLKVISHGFSKFGSNTVSNTIEIKIYHPEIFKITSDEGITLYLIEDSYDIPEEDCFTLIGRRKDGVWVTYFNTKDLTKKYFGEHQDHCWKKLSVSNDVVSIYYELYSRGNYRNPTQRGEFRFKWDEAAQWFSVEQVVY